jgi:hypothetical protein
MRRRQSVWPCRDGSDHTGRQAAGGTPEVLCRGYPFSFSSPAVVREDACFRRPCGVAQLRCPFLFRVVRVFRG